MLRSPRFWVGLAVTVLFLALFFWKLDYARTWDAVKQANYWWFLPAIAFYFVAVFFRTLRWQFLLAPLGSFRVGRLFPIVVVGYMANNLLPLRIGELVRSYYFSEREHASGSSALATIVLERVFDGLALLLFLVVAAIGLERAEGVNVLGAQGGPMSLLFAIILGVLFIGVTAVLTLVSLFPRFSTVLEGWSTIPFPGRLKPRVRGLAARFLEGFAALRSPRRQLAVLALSIPVWLCEGVMYYMAAYAFGLQHLLSSAGLVFAVVFLVTAAANLALTLPSSPGGVGPFELLTQRSLFAVGIPLANASAFAIALHLLLLAPVTLLGLFFLWRSNISLAQLARGGSRQVGAAARLGGPGGNAR